MSDTTMAAGIITLSAGDGRGTVSVDLGQIARAESEMERLAILNRGTAPEFARAMNRGYLDVSKTLLVVSRHRRRAEERVALREATILLDELPQIMVQKGISQANEGIRKAVFARDPERQQLYEVASQLEALEAVLKIKKEGFRNAFEAAKKVLGGGAGPSDVDTSHRPESTGQLATSWPTNGLSCPVCGLTQYLTPSGACCAQGHGGLEGIVGGQGG